MNPSTLPLFSVLTACKNQQEFVRETGLSLKAQSCQEFEWIFVDDASSQDLEHTLSDLRIPQLRYWKNQTGLGQTASLNAGIRVARSPWIVRVDGDDLLPPDRLELTKQAIQSFPQAKLLAGAYDVISETGEDLAQVRYQPQNLASLRKYLMEKNNPLCHPATCFFKHRKDGSLFLYDERLKNAQDYALWKDILSEYPDGLSLVPFQPLVRYRLVRGALSGARIREQTEELASVRAGKIPPASPARQGKALSAPQAEGMYNYRIAYFLFLDAAPFTWRKFLLTLRALGQTARFPPVFPKALAFCLGYPLKAAGKALLFRGIYR